MSELRVRSLITVCAPSHLPVWRIASRHVVANIAAERYCVIVPDASVKLFELHTPPQISVLPESDYTAPFAEVLRSKMPASKKHRYGWYLQQFIKMEALSREKVGAISLIWDSDSVPLKRLSFIQDNRIGHYCATEHHEPYFAVTKSLIGLPKLVPHSFIAQSFAIKAVWFEEFKTDIESRHGKVWWQAIIDAIDFTQNSGFSEYETMGTFIASRHAQEMFKILRPWCRMGNTLIGSVGNLRDPRYRDTLKSLDFITFENWDQGPRLPLKTP
jgi:hypothetical protein